MAAAAARGASIPPEVNEGSMYRDFAVYSTEAEVATAGFCPDVGSC